MYCCDYELVAVLKQSVDTLRLYAVEQIYGLEFYWVNYSKLYKSTADHIEMCEKSTSHLISYLFVPSSQKFVEWQIMCRTAFNHTVVLMHQRDVVQTHVRRVLRHSLSAPRPLLQR